MLIYSKVQAITIISRSIVSFINENLSAIWILFIYVLPYTVLAKNIEHPTKTYIFLFFVREIVK